MVQVGNLPDQIAVTGTQDRRVEVIWQASLHEIEHYQMGDWL